MTPEERVSTLAPRIKGALRRRPLPNFVEHEEAIQEGMIGAWQAARSKPSAGDSYLFAAARKRAIRDYRREKPFGAAPGRRWHTAPEPPGSLDAMSVEKTLAPSGWEDEVAEAAEVRAAVRDLPPRDREITFRRFWLQEALTGPERARWSAYTLPALREALADLAPQTRLAS